MNRAFLTIAALGASALIATGAEAQRPAPYAANDTKGTMSSWTPSAEGSYAKSAIQKAGFTSISDLTRGADGTWQARAMKNNAKVNVTLDRAGNVTSN
jgi:hypothetical protein